MKVRASVKRLCRNCKIIKRGGAVRVICKEARHKQKQGWFLRLNKLNSILLSLRGRVKINMRRD